MIDNETKVRREAIAQKIAGEFSVRTMRLAEEFQVSRNEIIKDLNSLEKEGILVRVRGGAIFQNTRRESPVSLRKNEHLEVKKRISRTLADHVEDGSVIFLTSSTTNLYVASMMEKKKDLTIYTNSLEMAYHLSDTQHTLVLVGGVYNHRERCTSGCDVLRMIEGVHFDLVILGMNGCKGMIGPATNDNDIHIMGKLVMRNSSRRILVSDQSKLDTYASYQFARFSDFDLVIMDTLSEEHRRIYLEENRGDARRLLEVMAF